MRIGIDGGCWSNRRGYGRFLRELLEAVAQRDAKNTYTVFLDTAAHAEFTLGPPFRPVLVRTWASVAEAANAAGRRSAGDLFRMSTAVARERLDLFFFPSVYSYFPLLRRVPAIVGIHDTIADRNPAFAFGGRRHEFYWKAKVRLALLQCRTVLTVSEYSKRSIESYLEVPARRIRVLYESAAAIFRRVPPKAGENRPYVLYAGGISPNKNLATLVRAFARLEPAVRGLRLVLAGDYVSDGFKSCYAELRALIQELGLAEHVSFPGYVPDGELCALYSGAGVFAMPSFDEGFGLPALEAMACGAPVVVSSGNSLEEVVGGAGLVVSPTDEAGLARALDRVLTDGELARDLSARSLRRAAEFSWSRTAEQLLEIFDETAKTNRAGRSLTAAARSRT